MRLTIALIVAVMLLAAPARAANLDLSAVTCKDFLASGKDNIAVIITWLDAYYKEENDPPIIDFDSFGRNSENLAKFCSENPTDGLIKAADQTFGKKKK